MTQKQIIDFLKKYPHKLGNSLGFKKLGDLHGDWISDMVFGDENRTLQAHRNSYKTTAVEVSIALMLVLYPQKKILFMRKTDNDVKEVVETVKKLMMNPIFKALVSELYKGINDSFNLRFTISNSNQINTNLTDSDPRGTPQLTAMGSESSLTGKHFDYIFTDDIVTINDRYSKAERERIKRIYQELEKNILNRGGRIYNTGTPWHKDDAFTLMPTPKKWDCYQTGIMTEDQINNLKYGSIDALTGRRVGKMDAAQFAANYELKHIAAENQMFSEIPERFSDGQKLENGFAHIDAAYGGADFCAFTIMARDGDHFYALGKLRPGHIDKHLDGFIDLSKKYMSRPIMTEDNADKGGTAKEIRRRGGKAANPYHESQNKHQKIAQYLYPNWGRILWHVDTDPEYLDMIYEYNEDADHDDSPDGASTLVRRYTRRSGTSGASTLSEVW